MHLDAYLNMINILTFHKEMTNLGITVNYLKDMISWSAQSVDGR